MDRQAQQICTGSCLFGKCPFETCIKYSQMERAAKQIDVDMQILAGNNTHALQSDKTGYGIAVDIGTTTVVAYLIHLNTCEQIGTASRINAQTTLGVDVISRIKLCTDVKDGLKNLQEAIITELNSLTGILLEKAHIKPEEISHMVITGNTTMLHLFAGISPVTMGYSPFTPASTFGYYADSGQFGLTASNARVYLTDCISSFVGGDITTAIVHSGLFYDEALCLLLDIGTNGEVALGNKDSILATSTAAGPAFEGAQIEHGMAGVKGAINSVYVLDGELKYTTIGGTAPQGICGSGIIDAMAVFLDTGLVDETGRILGADELPDALVKFLTSEKGAPAIRITEKIVITQKDIREIQTAKAAIAAGVLALLHEADKSFQDVSKIFLAGGFGNFMNAESAIKIGLLPKEAEGKILPIGNAAGAGAVMALCNDRYIEDCKKIAQLGRHVELGGNAYFMDKYVEAMLFI